MNDLVGTLERPPSKTRAAARWVASIIVYASLLVLLLDGTPYYELTDNGVDVIESLAPLAFGIFLGANWQNVRDAEAAVESKQVEAETFAALEMFSRAQVTEVEE